MATLESKYMIDAATGCWLWTAASRRSPRGGGIYGHVFHQGKTMLAHRVLYLMRYGSIPEGNDLHHVCKNTLCVNPDHLLPLTRRDHCLASDNAFSRKARATHCAHGHPFTTENTYRRGHLRQCRTCNAAAQRAYQQRKAAT